MVIDPPSDRVTQLVRNELIFATGAGTAPSAYRLALRATSRETTLGVVITGRASVQQVRVTAAYQLVRLEDELVIADTSAIASASYDAVEQRFANQRAAQDAQARAAREAALVIAAQLSALLAG